MANVWDIIERIGKGKTTKQNYNDISSISLRDIDSNRRTRVIQKGTPSYLRTPIKKTWNDNVELAK